MSTADRLFADDRRPTIKSPTVLRALQVALAGIDQQAGVGHHTRNELQKAAVEAAVICDRRAQRRVTAIRRDQRDAERREAREARRAEQARLRAQAQRDDARRKELERARRDDERRCARAVRRERWERLQLEAREARQARVRWCREQRHVIRLERRIRRQVAELWVAGVDPVERCSLWGAADPYVAADLLRDVPFSALRVSPMGVLLGDGGSQ